jgi:hypothetical protein
LAGNKKYTPRELPIRRTIRASNPRISLLRCLVVLDVNAGGLAIGGGFAEGALGGTGATTCPEIVPEGGGIK